MSNRHLPWLAFGVSIVILIALAALWTIPKPEEQLPTGQPAERQPVLVHCAAAMRVPVEAAAAEFEQTYGIKFQLSFGASESLVSTLRVSQQGDLLIPADE